MTRDLVLIVEDEIDLVQVMQAALAHAHPELEVRTFVTVDDAEEAFASEPELLSRCVLSVVDYRLGDRNGLDIIETLRAQEPPIPVLMLTGQAPASAEERARAVGARVAWKPMNLQDFLAAVDTMLAHQA